MSVLLPKQLSVSVGKYERCFLSITDKKKVWKRLITVTAKSPVTPDSGFDT